jgi:endonuclease/exonuclease/phosphatase family metal-dependent hydrolase
VDAITLRIMSYNIHQGTGSERTPGYGLEKVVQAILRHCPDVIGMQEVYRNGRKDIIEDIGARIAQRLSEECGETWYLAWVPCEDMCHQTRLPKNCRGYGDAILSRFPILATTHLTYNWGGKDRWCERRVCVQATIDVRGHHLNVFTTHPARTDVETQAPQIVDFARMFPEPRVHTGDYNLYADNPWFPATHASLTDGGRYIDAWMVAGQGSDGNTFPAGSLKTKLPNHRIDYIFHSATPGFVNKRTWVDQTESASDHCPLIAVYEWTPSDAHVPGGQVGEGSIAREVWRGLSAEMTVVSLREETANFTRPPSSIDRLLLFQAPWRIGERYGTRLRGWITAPIDGEYEFWIAGQANCELFLSADEDPAHVGREPIARVAAGTAVYTTKEGEAVTDSGHTGSAQWSKYPFQKSAPIRLRAGGRYYIEALHKDGDDVSEPYAEGRTVGDNLAVGWRLPDGLLERPIPGRRLSPHPVAATAPALDAALIVDAGPERTLPGAGVLAAEVRTPSGAPVQGRIQWSVVYGPGEARFWDRSDPCTLVTFSCQGTYVLRLAVENHALCAYDHVRLTVGPVA